MWNPLPRVSRNGTYCLAFGRGAGPEAGVPLPHHLVHEGGWAVEGNADDELTFTSPWGRTLSSRPPPLLPETKQRIHDITGLDLG